MVTAVTGKPGESLKALVVAPILWAIHFLVIYVAAAVFCAKAGDPAASLDWVRDLVWVATGIALAGIALNGSWAFWRGRIWQHGPGPHGADTVADRRRFLSYATLLLAGLSFVSTLFTAMPALFIGTCR